MNSLRRIISRVTLLSTSGVVLLLALLHGAWALSLTLDQALEIGLRDNQSVRIAEKRIAAAQAQVLSARGAFFPQVSVGGSLLRVGNLPNFSLGAQYYLPVMDTTAGGSSKTPYVVPQYEFAISSDREGTVYSAKASLSWPLFTGGKIWNGYWLTRLNREASEEFYRKTKADLVLNIKQSFYGLLLAQAAVKVTEEAVALTEAHLKRVEVLYQSGMVSKFDLLRAEVQLSNLQPALIRARNGRELAAKALLTTLNLDPNTLLEPVDELKYVPQETNQEAMVKEALQNRPETRELSLREKMGGRAISIAKAAYLPNVALVADYQKSRGQNFPPLDKEWQTGWDVGVAASLPIFDGLTNVGKIREARANREQVRLGEQQLEAGIRLEVTSAILNLQASEQTITSQEKNVEQAEEALRIAQVRYDSGQATNLDVLDAQVALSQARMNRFQALHDYLVAQAQLEKALGR